MNKTFQRIATILCAGVLTLSLAACGGSGEPAATSTPQGSAEPTAAAKKLVVGASASPHAEILEAIKPELAAQGIELEIKIFTDYIIPNTSLDKGELDANFFQHKPYMDEFNETRKTKLSSAVAVHFEPLGIYAGKSSDLDNVPDKAVIAVPNDATNEARALQLLEQKGVIKLKEGVGLNATKKDIAQNPHNVKIREVEAAQVPRSLSDADFAVINGNYALEAEVSADKLLFSEDKTSEVAQKYANILAVRTGDEDREEIKALVTALTSETARKFIEEKYTGRVIPVF